MSKSQKWKSFFFYFFCLISSCCPNGQQCPKSTFLTSPSLFFSPLPFSHHNSSVFCSIPVFFLFCFFFFLFAFTDTHGGSELLWRKTKSRLIIEHSLLLLFIFFRPWLLLVLWLSQFLCGCILTGLVLLYPFSLSWTTVTSYRAQAPLLTPRPHQPLLSTPQ